MKTSLKKICTPHFIVRLRKGYSRFYCESELETEQNCNILTPTLMAVSVVSFSFSRAAQPEAQRPSSLLDDGFLYCILSATSLDPNSFLAGCGFPYHISSITRLISNSNSSGPLRPGVAFPTTSYQQLISNCLTSVLTELYKSSTPTQSPTRSLEWHVCRHQAEITVMQFRGHFLPVYQSMSVSWDFLPCPISSSKHAHAISFNYWPLECVTSFRCITL